MRSYRNNTVEYILTSIKKEGISSPTGMYWNDYFLFLKKNKDHKDSDPSVPLILAASGESDASKHYRLSEQLYWAADYNCLDEAIEFLKNLSSEKGDSGSFEGWNKTGY